MPRSAPIAAALLLSTVALLAGCAGTARPLPSFREPAAAVDDAGLAAAAEAFHAATTPAQLREAVAAAERAGPGSARAHELAAILSELSGDEDAKFDHLEAALLDPADDAPLLHLHQLDEVLFSIDQSERAEALYGTLSAHHPDPAVRAAAAYKLATSRQLRGDPEGRDAALAGAGFQLPFAVVGSWDNDQGKGFDAELPPEKKLSLAERYDGSLLPIGWRTEVATDPRGRLFLEHLVAPSTWSVAYAAAAVVAPAEGDYELRLGTTDPVKVWVNGTLLLEARKLAPAEFDLFDQLVVPVRLRAGPNRILVKSAQQKDDWQLLARLTAPGGAPAKGLRAAPADTEPAEGPVAGVLVTPEQLLAARVKRLPEGSSRQLALRAAWATRMGARSAALADAEALAGRVPGAIVPRWLLSTELWGKGERDRTSDLLGELDRGAGDELPALRLLRARFLKEQGLKQTSRKALLSVREQHPALSLAWWRLADHYRDEGWTEDRCHALAEADRLRPGVAMLTLARADCADDLGFAAQAVALEQEVLAALPGHGRTLTLLADAAMKARDLERAEELASLSADASPHLPSAFLQLADIRRRAGDLAGARLALDRAHAIAPDNALVEKTLGRLLYQAGDRAGALARWQSALDRDPRDEGLAHRLEFLLPEHDGAWARDVPDESAIEAAVASRAKLSVLPGADVVYLLDHDVTHLTADGSTAAVVTQVAHAVNQAGRDRLTSLQMEGAGRARLLHAYAVDPTGHRVEASSIRGKKVHFRGLQVGSTVVLQYRRDAPPVGYLARHLAQVWWFQQPNQQASISQWVLWAPSTTRFHEAAPPGIDRTEQKVGDEVRVAWTARDTRPVLPEPRMPPLRETAEHLLVSTVPTWETYLRWEEALLDDAFRESPELISVADRLFAGAATQEEKANRIQKFLVEEIRYQQDYEDAIAGVKPHPAPMTLTRKYGDCKDKAVLFITLARRAGIDANFALVRTRGVGPVEVEVPMQQFNHAIVYVPAQAGIAEGHFYDPTADALEVKATRQDDPGTHALVFDPRTKTHEWRDIPYQAPSTHEQRMEVGLSLSQDGSTEGDLRLTGTGLFGAQLRLAARNSEKLAQGFRQLVGDTFSGASVKTVVPGEVKELHVPAEVKASFHASSVGRREGDELRMKIPTGWSPNGWFNLSDRKHPLLLGVPAILSWRVEVALPEGARIKRVPSAGRIDTRCLLLERIPSQVEGKVVIEQKLTIKCERIPVAEYPAHRAQAEAMIRLLDEELVLDVGAKGRPTMSKR